MALFAGEGPLRGELTALARELGVDARFAGYLDEPAPLYEPAVGDRRAEDGSDDAGPDAAQDSPE